MRARRQTTASGPLENGVAGTGCGDIGGRGLAGCYFLRSCRLRRPVTKTVTHASQQGVTDVKSGAGPLLLGIKDNQHTCGAADAEPVRLRQ
jgi:hypothetical protein